MAQVTFSTQDLIKKGWQGFTQNIVLFLKIGLTFFVLGVIVFVINLSTRNDSSVNLIVSLVDDVIRTILSIGLIKIGLDIVDGKKPNFKDFYSHANKFINFFFTSLVVGIFIIVGLIIFIIPGIYLAIKYQFTPYIVVDKELSFGKAWGASSDMVKGNWMKIFIFDLAIIGLNILGAIALGVGLILTIPTSFLAGLYLYRKLSA